MSMLAARCLNIVLIMEPAEFVYRWNQLNLFIDGTSSISLSIAISYMQHCFGGVRVWGKGGREGINFTRRGQMVRKER